MTQFKIRKASAPSKSKNLRTLVSRFINSRERVLRQKEEWNLGHANRMTWIRGRLSTLSAAPAVTMAKMILQLNPQLEFFVPATTDADYDKVRQTLDSIYNACWKEVGI